MKKSDYTGWQEVFRFSLMQGVKQKSYFCVLIVMSLILIFSQPVSSLIKGMGEDEEAYHSEVTDFTIYDETGLPIDYSEALADAAFDDVTIHTDSSQTFEEHVAALEESEESTEILVRVAYEQAGYFNLTFVKASDADLKEEDCEKLAEAFEDFFEEARISAIDVSREQLAFINQDVATKLEFITQTGEAVPEKEEAEGISYEEYMIMLVGITAVTMIISMSGSSIAVSIVTEKSTRVVEYLMINIRPMALIAGKILASLLMVVIQIGAMGISYGISVVLNGILLPEKSSAEGELDLSAMGELLSGITLDKVLIAVVIILCGVLFYSIMAGLAGASVSKMEEIAEGMKIYQMLMVVGAYLGIGMCFVLMLGGDNQTFVTICSLLPISAPFVVPASVLLGKISMGLAIASMVLLLVLTILLFAFTANVYESMIFYNGSVLKLKDILQIAKNRRQSAGREEKHHE